jgi:hypothetical protein
MNTRKLLPASVGAQPVWSRLIVAKNKISNSPPARPWSDSGVTMCPEKNKNSSRQTKLNVTSNRAFDVRPGCLLVIILPIRGAALIFFCSNCSKSNASIWKDHSILLIDKQVFSESICTFGYDSFLMERSEGRVGLPRMFAVLLVLDKRLSALLT